MREEGKNDKGWKKEGYRPGAGRRRNGGVKRISVEKKTHQEESNKIQRKKHKKQRRHKRGEQSKDREGEQ